jgi:NADPH:quinone reductase-like Zn-dependent oxidoreductase
MRAVVQVGYGSAEVLRLDRVARPEAADDEVLLRVRAAGLDRGTWHLVTGRPYLVRLVSGVREPRRPVPGMEVAGTVEAVGGAVSGFEVGDEVFGFGRGTFAEYAVVRRDRLARKPVNTTFEQAAVVPVSAVTALQALRDVGRLQPGQRVLVIGASGGVGAYAVQLAKARGAEVTGVASTANLDFVTSLGADHVVDYTREDFADGVHRYDLVLDLAGNPSLGRLRRALTPRGTVVLGGGEEGDRWTGGMGRMLRARALSPFRRQRLTNFVAKQRATDLETLKDLIEASRVTPHVDRAFSLDEAPDALRYLAAGKVRGKVVITL